MTKVKGDFMSKGEILTIEQILDRSRQYLEQSDVDIIYRAYLFAKDADAQQFRKSGEPYIIHPVQVAGILIGLDLDPATIAAGFLHDVVEDTDISLETIEETFSEEVAMLVDGVTKLGKLKIKRKKPNQQKNNKKRLST